MYSAGFPGRDAAFSAWPLLHAVDNDKTRAVLAVFTVIAVSLFDIIFCSVPCLCLVLSGSAAVSVRYRNIRYTFSFHRGDASRRMSAGDHCSLS